MSGTLYLKLTGKLGFIFLPPENRKWDSRKERVYQGDRGDWGSGRRTIVVGELVVLGGGARGQIH